MFARNSNTTAAAVSRLAANSLYTHVHAHVQCNSFSRLSHSASSSSSSSYATSSSSSSSCRCVSCSFRSSPSSSSSSSVSSSSSIHSSLQTRSFHASSPLAAWKAPHDLYQVLNISKTATQDEIKKAYFQMAKKFHPDAKSEDPDAKEKFNAATKAWEVLGDEKKRKEYDMYGTTDENMGHGGPGAGSPFGAGFEGMGGFDAASIFEQFLRQHGGGGGGASPFDFIFQQGGGRGRGMRGLDHDVSVNLDFMEAVEGTSKEVEVERLSPCTPCNSTGVQPGTTPSTCKRCSGSGRITMQSGPYQMVSICQQCNGSGKRVTPCKTCNGEAATPQKAKVKVQIPAGIPDKATLRVAQQGSSAPGLPSGHLWVHVNVREHPVFQRDGADVHVYQSIALSTAALGGTVVVPTLSGEADVKIPAGSRSGDRLILRNKGTPKFGSTGKGNQYVHLDIHVPKKLTPRQTQLLEELAKIDAEEAQTRREQSSKPEQPPSSWFQRFKDLINKRNRE